MIKCYACKKELPENCFNKKKTNPNGFQRICRDCQKIDRKAYYDKNKAKEFEAHAKYVEANKERVNSKRNIRRAESPEYYKKVSAYIAKRKEKDLGFLIFNRYGKRIGRALKEYNAIRSASNRALVGCTDEAFICHLEATRLDGMTLDDLKSARAQIDHIIPCCCFDLTKAHHQRACFHYTNTRLLWTSDNCSKSLNRFPSKNEVEAYSLRFLE